MLACVFRGRLFSWLCPISLRDYYTVYLPFLLLMEIMENFMEFPSWGMSWRTYIRMSFAILGNFSLLLLLNKLNVNFIWIISFHLCSR